MGGNTRRNKRNIVRKIMMCLLLTGCHNDDDDYVLSDNPKIDKIPVVLFEPEKPDLTIDNNWEQTKNHGSPIPEPGTLLLLGSGLSALALMRKKNDKSRNI